MTPKSIASSIISLPFDMTELGAHALDRCEVSFLFVEWNLGIYLFFLFQQPFQIGVLWYLNVHLGLPYRWQHCEAILLSWIAPGGSRGIVTLDLLNYAEVRSVPSGTREDIETIPTRVQVAGGHGSNLLELLCSSSQLLFSNDIVKLAAKSTHERDC